LLFNIFSIYIRSNSIIYSVEATSTWLQTKDSDFNKGSLDNVTIEGEKENAILKLTEIKSELFNWKMKNPPFKPRSRSEHGMASIWGTDKVLLFGAGDNFTWIYDLSDNNWINKNTSNNPSKRYEHGMASIWGTDKVLLFGGGSGYLDDTWIYDLSDNNWTRKFPKTVPPARNEFSMTSIYGTDKVLFFGGHDGDYLDDCWVYCLGNNDWVQKANGPSCRNSQGMASIYSTDKIVLFGGYDGIIRYNDTWIYDLSEDKWTKININRSPDGRHLHGMASIYNDDKVIMYGGFNEVLTWVYDFSNNIWSNITLINNPGIRYDHAMASIDVDKVLLFGGSKNETWLLSYFQYAKNGTFISHPYDIGSNSSYKTINWCANISINSSIKLQLRSSLTEYDLINKNFIGPDGTKLTYYINSNSNIWSGHNGDRWTQYKIYFNTNDVRETPTLENVTIEYNHWPLTTLISPKNETIFSNNNPTFCWNFTDYDSTHQIAFQVLISNNNLFNNVIFDSDEQMSVIQNWKFSIGTNFSKLPDGIWYWKVRVKDNDGDWGLYTSPFKIIVDTKAPNSKIVFPVNNTFYKDLKKITGTAINIENGTELIKVEISINCLKNNLYWDGTNWDLNKTWLLAKGTTDWSFNSILVKWTSGTQYDVQSRATDFVLNVENSISRNIFTIDKDKPKSNIEFPNNNTYLNKLNEIKGNSNDFWGSGVNKVKISINRIIDDMYWSGLNWIKQETWLSVHGTINWLYDSSLIAWTSNNQYIVRSLAIDSVNNTEIPNNGVTFLIDLDMPLSNIDYPKNSSYLNHLEIISGNSFDFGGSGVSSVKISIEQTIDKTYWDGFGWSSTVSWINTTGKNQWYCNVTQIIWITDIYYNICSRALDKVGNMEVPGPGIRFMYDNKPPDISITIYYGKNYTKYSTLFLSLFSEDSGSGVSQMGFSTDGTLWSDWEQNLPSKLYDVTKNDGEKIVYFRVKDKANNSAMTYDKIILDTTPPYALNITLNEGINETNSTSLILNVYAIDNLSGVDQMSISIDGINWSVWEKYITIKKYNLSGNDGKKIIYFKVKDRVGNIAKPVSVSIILNTTELEENKNQDKTKSPPDKSTSSMIYWMFLIIIIVIIIISLFVGLIVKRKRKSEQEPSPIEAGPPDSEVPHAPEHVPKVVTATPITIPTADTTEANSTQTIQATSAPTPIPGQTPQPQIPETPEQPQLLPVQPDDRN